MGGMCSLYWEGKGIKSLKPEGERKLKRNYRNIEVQYSAGGSLYGKGL